MGNYWLDQERRTWHGWADLAEIHFTLTKDVIFNHRRMKAIWSIEAQEDLRAMHNLDAEKTLAKILSDEVKELYGTESTSA